MILLFKKLSTFATVENMNHVIVGLGNPGAKFERTRHNAGFMALDLFAEKNGFPEFEFSKKHNALVSEDNDIVLVKPQTFMNESGKTISSFKLPATSFIVIHDDIDLPLGTLKFSHASGSGGHKGIDSIINALGSNQIARLRIGICPPAGKPATVETFVIKKFTPEEMETLSPAIGKAAQAIDCFIAHGLEKAMNEYN
jgi:PTH1 family peptidyl-tRNA hydrolase